MTMTSASGSLGLLFTTTLAGAFQVNLLSVQPWVLTRYPMTVQPSMKRSSRSEGQESVGKIRRPRQDAQRVPILRSSDIDVSGSSNLPSVYTVDSSISDASSSASVDVDLQATEVPAVEVPAPEVPATEEPASEVLAPEVPAPEVPAPEVPAPEADTAGVPEPVSAPEPYASPNAAYFSQLDSGSSNAAAGTVDTQPASSTTDGAGSQSSYSDGMWVAAGQKMSPGVFRALQEDQSELHDQPSQPAAPIKELAPKASNNIVARIVRPIRNYFFGSGSITKGVLLSLVVAIITTNCIALQLNWIFCTFVALKQTLEAHAVAGVTYMTPESLDLFNSGASRFLALTQRFTYIRAGLIVACAPLVNRFINRIVDSPRYNRILATLACVSFVLLFTFVASSAALLPFLSKLSGVPIVAPQMGLSPTGLV